MTNSTIESNADIMSISCLCYQPIHSTRLHLIFHSQEFIILILKVKESETIPYKWHRLFLKTHSNKPFIVQSFKQTTISIALSPSAIFNQWTQHALIDKHTVDKFKNGAANWPQQWPRNTPRTYNITPPKTNMFHIWRKNLAHLTSASHFYLRSYAVSTDLTHSILYQYVFSFLTLHKRRMNELQRKLDEE